MRLRRGLAAGLALVLLASPVHAQSGELLELVPTAQWGLDYGDNNCALYRRFTSAAGHLDLRIEMTTPGHNFGLLVASETFAAGQGAVSISVGPSFEQRTFENPQRGQVGSTSAVRFRDTLLPVGAPNAALSDPASIERYLLAEASITNLVIDDAFDRPVSLRLGTMVNPMTALRSCVDDLLISWGMNPASATAVTVPPVRVSQARWAQRVRDAFLRSPRHAARSGQIHIVLAIASDGSVERCHAQSSQADHAIETVACESLTAHARYEPARDAAGNAVPGFDWMDVAYLTSP
jgi:hypothetical protein